MPHQMFTFLSDLNEIAKKNQTGPIVCHWCNNQDNIIKYGFYKRYEFLGKVKIRIQRFFCKRDKCRRTFSILPHPFLRFTSLSLCMFTVLLQLFDQGIPIAEICRRLGLSWSMADWAIKRGRRILYWIDQEAKTEPTWAPSPCIDPPGHWSEFIRMFAIKFYPKRYA